MKTALESTSKKALRRERNNYLIPGIRSSAYVRRQVDILQSDLDFGGESVPRAEDEMASAPAGMVFEWMEWDLR